MFDLETPVPLVDLDRMHANLDRMAAYTSQHGLHLRPHAKTHKSPVVAAEQVKRGAVGMTCATPREAEVLRAATTNLLVAYPPVGAARAKRLAALPDDVRLRVALDSSEAAEQLARAASAAGREIEVLVEVDLGMHRVGVQTANDAVTLARQIRALAPLRYAGIAFYPGHVREAVDQQDAKLADLATRITQLLQTLEREGVRADVVSGGSTPTAWRAHELPGVTEVRPGTYVYNDRTTAEIGACAWEDCALSVLATVVSTAVPEQAVVDAGSKALAREPLRADGAGGGFAVMIDRPDVTVKAMSEEHGLLDLSQTDWRPRVGDQVRLLPNHVCAVVHLFDEVVGLRGDKIETRWKVEARGRMPIAQ
jgi:D-serine deaminase-like pyridoxal phosphate-dependent protein